MVGGYREGGRSSNELWEEASISCCTVCTKSAYCFVRRQKDNLYGPVYAAVQGHHVGVKSRIEPSVHDSSDVTSAAKLGICVYKKKCWHSMFRRIVMSKCSIWRNLKHISGFIAWWNVCVEGECWYVQNKKYIKMAAES